MITLVDTDGRAWCGCVAVPAFDHVWYWRKVLPDRKGQPCRITARGKLNNIRVEFPDGYIVITSRHAVRRRRA